MSPPSARETRFISAENVFFQFMSVAAWVNMSLCNATSRLLKGWRVFWWLLGECFTSLLIFILFYSPSSLTLRSTGDSKFSCFTASKSKRKKANLNLCFHPDASAECDYPDEEQTHLKHHFWSTTVFELYVSSLHLTEFEVSICLRWSEEASHWCSLIYGCLLWRLRTLSEIGSTQMLTVASH